MSAVRAELKANEHLKLVADLESAKHDRDQAMQLLIEIREGKHSIPGVLEQIDRLIPGRRRRKPDPVRKAVLRVLDRWEAVVVAARHVREYQAQDAIDELEASMKNLSELVERNASS